MKHKHMGKQGLQGESIAVGTKLSLCIIIEFGKRVINFGLTGKFLNI
jgi:hypothetical protein